ncbi:hypothetical protein A5785_06935 [Gordonia sp. 852002-50395_SCH5434458]|nr:hypothetical protein A5785_06935 [Gordonia sp. 852002-50395_SCH5434458]
MVRRDDPRTESSDTMHQFDVFAVGYRRKPAHRVIGGGAHSEVRAMNVTVALPISIRLGVATLDVSRPPRPSVGRHGAEVTVGTVVGEVKLLLEPVWRDPAIGVGAGKPGRSVIDGTPGAVSREAFASCSPHGAEGTRDHLHAKRYPTRGRVRAIVEDDRHSYLVRGVARRDENARHTIGDEIFLIVRRHNDGNPVDCSR